MFTWFTYLHISEKRQITMSYLLQREAHSGLLAASLAEASNIGGDLILVSAEGHRSLHSPHSIVGQFCQL